MKYFTAQIDRAFFDQHIKDDISPTFTWKGDTISCYVIKCNLLGGCEVWLLADENSIFPSTVYKVTNSVKTEYTFEEFQTVIPSYLSPEILNYIHLINIATTW
jgi:hypothetical protein